MKITGIKALCSDTKKLDPVGYAPRYMIQVHIDKSTGKLWWADIAGSNSYIQYNDPNMIYIGNIEHPATMAEIREMVEDRLAAYFHSLELINR